MSDGPIRSELRRGAIRAAPLSAPVLVVVVVAAAAAVARLARMP